MQEDNLESCILHWASTRLVFWCFCYELSCCKSRDSLDVLETCMGLICAVYAVLSFTCGSLRESVHGSEGGDCRITSTGGGGDKAGSQSVEGYPCRSLTSYPRSGFHKP